MRPEINFLGTDQYEGKTCVECRYGAVDSNGDCVIDSDHQALGLRDRVSSVRQEMQINALQFRPEKIDISGLRDLSVHSVAGLTGIPAEALQIDLRLRVQMKRRMALNERRAKQ